MAPIFKRIKKKFDTCIENTEHQRLLNDLGKSTHVTRNNLKKI